MLFCLTFLFRMSGDKGEHVFAYMFLRMPNTGGKHMPIAGPARGGAKKSARASDDTGARAWREGVEGG